MSPSFETLERTCKLNGWPQDARVGPRRKGMRKRPAGISLPEVHDKRSVIARFAFAECGFAFVPVNEDFGATLRDHTRP